MLARWRDIFAAHQVVPGGIVYGGAHHGELVPEFLAAGFERILAIEASSEAFARLRRLESAVVRCLNVAIADRRGVSPYFMFDDWPTLNSTEEPEADYWRAAEHDGKRLLREGSLRRSEVHCDRLDNVVSPASDYNVLYLNIQGGEPRALAGAEALLDQLDAVAVEVNFAKRYGASATFSPLTRCLSERGFRLMLLEKYAWSRGDHGEAFYRRVAPLRLTKPQDSLL